ncbi:hypothetical protein JZX87_05340 [Agrobacterium sp. Ap1]|uniref:hypothetical protein n=1 Tax=Agrobacterium sp. Ap1 TaxID=2815337 RepID=UPI001A8FA98A|nr:hypothetical protein [Agrobacterium sp. Ap1]MBO0140591.1 hypothetical protein [Agrobacterium sp. Ap1]
MSDQKTRERRSPPRDKQLSLEKDGRNDSGENSKSSRKNIPLFKAQSNRRGRHGARIAINTIAADGDTVQAERQLLFADHKALQPSKTKSPDTPLGETLQKKGKRPSK